MRKRIFSRLMALCLVMAMLSTSAWAYPLCDALDENGDWYEDQSAAYNSENKTYEYEVTEKTTTLVKTLEIDDGRNVSIDLQGNTLKLSDKAEDGSSVINVTNGSSLTIEDSSGKDETGEYVSAGEGVITGGKCTTKEVMAPWGEPDIDYIGGSGIVVSGEGSKVTMNGGNITGNTANNGGGIRAESGTAVVVNNGSISGNTVNRRFNGGKGGGIYADHSTVEINGGSIANNSSDGIYVKNGSTVTLNNGTIEGSNSGVTLYDSTIEMNNGSIKDNAYGISACRSNVTIYDGEISGCGVGLPYGGGLYMYIGSSLIMNNGRIVNNNTGIDFSMSSSDEATMTINGGTISNNKFGITVEYSTENEKTRIIIDTDKATICGNDRYNINCGKTITYETIHDDEYHTYAPATCIAPETCVGCGDTRGEVDPTNHVGTPVSDAEEPATCTKTGLTAGSHCVCGHVFTEQEIVPMLPHSYSSEVTQTPDYGVTGLRTYTCTVCGDTYTESIPALVAVVFGEQVTGDGTGTGIGTNNGTEIANDLIPLAGIVTEAQLLDALYQHEDAPEVEVVEKYADHEYAPAISWALANGIVVEDEFDPDEIVTVAILRDVLTAYVEYKAIDFTVTVDGEDDEIVMDLGERLTAFFAELEK